MSRLQMPFNLLDLPDDILQLIIEQLNLKDFFHFSLTCSTILKYFICHRYDNLFKYVIHNEDRFVENAEMTSWKSTVKRYVSIKHNLMKPAVVVSKQLQLKSNSLPPAKIVSSSASSISSSKYYNDNKHKKNQRKCNFNSNKNEQINITIDFKNNIISGDNYSMALSFDASGSKPFPDTTLHEIQSNLNNDKWRFDPPLYYRKNKFHYCIYNNNNNCIASNSNNNNIAYVVYKYGDVITFKAYSRVTKHHKTSRVLWTTEFESPKVHVKDIMVHSQYLLMPIYNLDMSHYKEFSILVLNRRNGKLVGFSKGYDSNNTNSKSQHASSRTRSQLLHICPTHIFFECMESNTKSFKVVSKPLKNFIKELDKNVYKEFFSYDSIKTDVDDMVIKGSQRKETPWYPLVQLCDVNTRKLYSSIHGNLYIGYFESSDVNSGLKSFHSRSVTSHTRDQVSAMESNRFAEGKQGKTGYIFVYNMASRQKRYYTYQRNQDSNGSVCNLMINNRMEVSVLNDLNINEVTI